MTTQNNISRDELFRETVVDIIDICNLDRYPEVTEEMVQKKLEEFETELLKRLVATIKALPARPLLPGGPPRWLDANDVLAVVEGTK